jgi:A/G-specific adenine glycosylase
VTRAAVASAPPHFAKRLLNWQATHGRSGLPWQNTRDPYRVWLSEIMLQQTQVTTVKLYYAKFLARFPQVTDLAAAGQDEVMALWAGLGYYSRARNLHACAKAVVAQHGGSFPNTAALLQTLPGIGPSTAAAIASFCFGERVAILDGNVKRVLARVHAFEHDIAVAKNEKLLLQLANELLPTKNLNEHMPRYTQAIMDLGATVCTPRQPSCDACPMASICQAKAQGRVHELPLKIKKLKRSSQSIWLLLARRKDGAVLLQQRPTPGVWAGLYCLPLFDSEAELLAPLSRAHQKGLLTHTPFLHVLTHKDLHLHILEISGEPKSIPGVWTLDLQAVGLPSPIKKLLAPTAIIPS